jgi:hypothetical protein
MSWLRRVPLFAFAVLTLVCLAPARAATPADAGALAERMLEALGGRATWASLTGTMNDSRQNRIDEPTVVRAVIHMDFTRPRFRIETTAPGLRLIRVVDGERHWRLSMAGRIEPLPDSTLASDLRWYAAHVYRTIHRVAAREPGITLRTGADGRLEVLENGVRIAWYALDAKGEPYAFGAHADDAGSLCGPWSVVRDGIHHPAWVSNRDGSWRAMIQALETNVPLEDSLFVMPAAGALPR